MTIEFDCEGCGDHVIAFGRSEVPRSGFCAACEWFCEHVPNPEQMMELRADQGRLNLDRPRRRTPRD